MFTLDNPDDLRKAVRTTMKTKNIKALDEAIKSMNKEQPLAKIDRSTVIEGLIEQFLETRKKAKK